MLKTIGKGEVRRTKLKMVRILCVCNEFDAVRWVGNFRHNNYTYPCKLPKYVNNKRLIIGTRVKATNPKAWVCIWKARKNLVE